MISFRYILPHVSAVGGAILLSHIFTKNSNKVVNICKLDINFYELIPHYMIGIIIGGIAGWFIGTSITDILVNL